jgi:hypothetical protein
LREELSQSEDVLEQTRETVAAHLALRREETRTDGDSDSILVARSIWRRLEADRDRYRAALEEISEEPEWCVNGCGEHVRQALNPTDGD